MIVRFNNAMTCQVRQYNKDISAHQGRYLDLKLHPELAAELPEAREWPALGQFVEAINRCNAFRTCGCTASGATPGGHEAPFVDIAFEHPRLQASSGAYQRLSGVLLGLDGTSVADDFIVELCDCSAALPDGKEIITSRLWFLGRRDKAVDVFQRIVALLAQQDAKDYMAVADRDYAKAAREHRQTVLRVSLLLLAWFLVGCGGAALAGTRLGWLAGIGGFVGGLVAFPVVCISCLYIYLRYFG